MPVQCTCLVCADSFATESWRVKIGKGKYCSIACSAIGRGGPRPDYKIRMWGFVQKNPGCWLWQGSKDPKGYGQFRIGPTLYRVGRLFWEEAAGQPMPHGLLACHDCPEGDDPACVRNDTVSWKEINGVVRPKYGHLWAGTAAENTADMVAKGRNENGSAYASRERHRRPKS